MGGKNRTRRIRWKPLDIENVFDISSSTTSEDTADLHDEEFPEGNRRRKSRGSTFQNKGYNSRTDPRSHHRHYREPRYDNNYHPAYGANYASRKPDHYAGYRSQPYAKLFERTESHAQFRRNPISQIPATGVYVNGLWIPASEVERIISNGELPPPPYGPAIPPAIPPSICQQKNLYFYYGYMRRESNEKPSDCAPEEAATIRQGDEAARGGASSGGGGQTNEDYIPVIYASSCAPPARRPFTSNKFRRRRFLDNDYVDLESDNCDIITKVTPKNYHFILSLDKASGSEPSESATPPASSEEFEGDSSSTDTCVAPPASPTLVSNDGSFEFGTISEIGRESFDVTPTENTTPDAMIEEYAQRAINSIIEDALKQIKISETKESSSQPGCSGITATELYAEKLARTIMGGVMVESSGRRPPPTAMEDPTDADPSAAPSGNERKQLSLQRADQMATEIIESALHPPDARPPVAKDDRSAQDSTQVSPMSRLEGVGKALEEGVRGSVNFLGQGATSTGSGEASPRAPQPTAATISPTPPPVQLPGAPPDPQNPPAQRREVQSERSHASDHCQPSFPRSFDWASLTAPTGTEGSQLDGGQRKSNSMEQGSKAAGFDHGAPLKAADKTTTLPDSGIQPEIDDGEHVVFAVTSPGSAHPLSRERSAASERPSDSKPAYFNLAGHVPFLPPDVRSFRPFGYCCNLM